MNVGNVSNIKNVYAIFFAFALVLLFPYFFHVSLMSYGTVSVNKSLVIQITRPITHELQVPQKPDFQ